MDDFMTIIEEKCPNLTQAEKDKILGIMVRGK